MIRNILTGVILFSALAACETAPTASGRGQNSDTSHANTAKTTSAPAPGRPLAFVDGSPITQGDMETALYEAAGGQILTEVILDRLLTQRLIKAKIVVTEAMIEKERQLLREILATDPNRAQRLIEELRLRRGLGDHRFEALLRRSAGLRALIQDQIEVTPAAIDQAWQFEYGPRYEARLIIAESLASASALVKRARAGESFIDLAIAHSVDESRLQGGLIGAVSPVDPTFPNAVRDSLVSLAPGEVSDPIALEQGFAILRLQRKIPVQDVKIEQVRPNLTRRVRRDLEDLRMRQLRIALMKEADIIIMNPALKESYKQFHKRQGDE